MGTHRTRAAIGAGALVALVAGLAAWRLAPPSDWPAGSVVARSPGRTLTLQFDLSYGANLFYVVDQVSRWDDHTHPYYAAYWRKRFGLSRQDAAAFDDYRRVRRQYPWGVLEPVFYGPGGGRASWARLRHVVEGPDQDAVRATLERFRPEFDRIWSSAGYLAPMARDLVAHLGPERAVLFEQAGRVFQSPPRSLEVLPIWSPEPMAGGGGFNGGRIALEMPRGRPLERLGSVLAHEALHAYQEPWEDRLRAYGTKRGIPGDVMHEAILYAMAPGVDSRRRRAPDPLPGQVADMERQDVSPDDALYQTRKLALALEPLADAALRQGRPLPQFLPAVASTWRRLLARDRYLSQLRTLKDRPATAGLDTEVRGGRLFVDAVDSGSPADAAGIRPGDEITAVRGRALADWRRAGVRPGQVPWKLLRGKDRETVALGILRGGRPLSFRLRLSVAAAPSAQPSEPQALALCRRDAAEAINARLNLYLDAFGPEAIAGKAVGSPRKPLIIAFSPDDMTMPREVMPLLPVPYDDMMRRIGAGQTVTGEKPAPGGLVVLLAAPDRHQLLRLIEHYDFSRLLAQVRR